MFSRWHTIFTGKSIQHNDAVMWNNVLEWVGSRMSQDANGETGGPSKIWKASCVDMLQRTDSVSSAY